MIDYKPGVFHVKDLHNVLVAVHENEYPSVTDILVHQGVDNTTQGVKTFAHIHRKRIQIILQ
jgi:hypothetical protein